MDPDKFSEHENAERILEQGWQLFQQKGYRGVTIDELCLRCKLSKPTLYYYFQDKENLFVQILQYKLRGFREVIEQPGIIQVRLQHIAVYILENFQTSYTTLLRDREHVKNPANLQKIRESFRSELFGPLITLMQAGIDQGELKGNDPELLALVFLGIINNFIGKAAEMEMKTASLAQQLTKYYLYGVKIK